MTEEIKVVVKGKGKMVFSLNRIRSPRTINWFLRSLPLKGNLYRDGKLMLIETNIKVSPEKPVTRVNKGEFGYWPLKRAIFIAKEESKIKFPVNLLGKLVKGFDVLEGIKAMDLVEIRRLVEK